MKYNFLVLCLGACTVISNVYAQPAVYEINAGNTAVRPASKIDMQGSNPGGTKLSVNSLYWEKNGHPWFPIMGEMHYNRVPPEEWEQEIQKMKSGGLSVVATYVFWNEHEPTKDVWDWKSNRDLRRFVALCGENGMYVWLRIGPWSHGEQLNGGFPDWIQKMKDKRSNDPAYLAEVTKLFTQIGDQTKGLYFRDGGPVIGVQLENEYAAGQAEHISMLKEIALSAGIQPVYWTVTANTVFDDSKMEVIPLQGSYPYRGWEKSGGGPTRDFLYGDDQWIMTGALGKLYYDVGKFPRGLCEQGCGSQMTYKNRFVVKPDVVEAHLQNQLGRGMNLIGYYMFHGGTQTPGLEEPGLPLSYDFQSPISEFGLLRPSYRYLKILHHFINDFGADLAPMQVVEPANPVRDVRNIKDLRYVARVKANSGFLFLCNTQVRVLMPDKQVTMKVNLPGETILFPSFLLKGQTTAILPFNMTVESILIKYATAQPFAKITNEGVTTIFFQQLPAVNPQVQIDMTTVKSIETKGWQVKRINNNNIFTAGAGKFIKLIDKNGRAITLVFLSRKETENSWRLRIRNTEALLITDADMIMGKDTLQLTQLDNPAFRFKIYPSGLDAIEGRKASRANLFDVYDIAVKPVIPAVRILQIKNGKADIQLPPTLPPRASDIVLRINYRGGSCILSQNGKQVTDNLFNGETWLMGTKRFLGNGSLLLQVRDWNDRITGVPDKLASEIKTNGKSIKGIKVLPQYCIKLNITDL
jgi:hypothetical protein